jgi:hypothetical protein
MEAFYVPDGEWFVSTVLTRGPWDARAQHGGPPAALMATRIEAAHPRPEMQVVRLTVEILRPIPIEPLRVHTTLLRPGRSVELLGATLETAAGAVARASCVRIRAASGLPLDRIEDPAPPPPGPAAGAPSRFFPTGWEAGYHTAMEGRFVRGDFNEPGPGTAWMRMRHPLVAGEPITPLARVVIAADSGNGVGGALDYRQWMFVNPDLTVYLLRPPAGEWICLDARSAVEPHGIGLCESWLFDEAGCIGRGLQSLFVDRQRS